MRHFRTTDEGPAHAPATEATRLAPTEADGRGRGPAGEDRLRRRFDAFRRWDDFSRRRIVHPGEPPQHSPSGTLRA